MVGATYRGTSLAIGTGAARAPSQTLKRSKGGLGRQAPGRCWPWEMLQQASVPESSLPHSPVTLEGGHQAVPNPSTPCPCRAHLGTRETGFTGAASFTRRALGANGAGGAALAGGTLEGRDSSHPGCRASAGTGTGAVLQGEAVAQHRLHHRVAQIGGEGGVTSASCPHHPVGDTAPVPVQEGGGGGHLPWDQRCRQRRGSRGCREHPAMEGRGVRVVVGGAGARGRG